MMATITKLVTITGRVQGVWYRGWTVDTARHLGLSGWVRNRTSGEVEALVQGDVSAVERFLALAWDGPSAARVDEVETRDVPPEELHGFEQRATA